MDLKEEAGLSVTGHDGWAAISPGKERLIVGEVQPTECALPVAGTTTFREHRAYDVAVSYRICVDQCLALSFWFFGKGC